MIAWLEAFVQLSHQRLLDCPSTHPAQQLLSARGVTPETIVEYRLGWVPDMTGITACTPEFWTWIQRYGWDTLVFPLTDPFGHVIGLELRSLRKKDYRDFLAVPKEVCPLVFGLSTALPVVFSSRRVVLVEGIFDYFAVRRHTPEVLAVLTSNVSLTQRRLLSRFADRVVCLFDMDAPGRRGCYRLAGLEIPQQFRTPKDLTFRIPAMPPYLVSFPSYSEHDPSDLWQVGKHDELRNLATYGHAPSFPAPVGAT